MQRSKHFFNIQIKFQFILLIINLLCLILDIVILVRQDDGSRIFCKLLSLCCLFSNYNLIMCLIFSQGF